MYFQYMIRYDVKGEKRSSDAVNALEALNPFLRNKCSSKKVQYEDLMEPHKKEQQ